MGSAAQAIPHQAEAEFLKGLRSRYEDQGFTFTIAPDRSVLPAFLASYVPDAIAQKSGQNVAIELKQHQSPAGQRSLQEIRRLFEGHPDWQFHVVYMNSGPLPSITIPPASPAAIRGRMDEVRTLSKDGHQRAALVIAWSLLEAALQSVDGDAASKPRTPGTVVQTLAMNGFISADTERGIRELIQLRNRIVHGDVAAEPTAEHVALVLNAVEDTLALDAA